LCSGTKSLNFGFLHSFSSSSAGVTAHAVLANVTALIRTAVFQQFANFMMGLLIIIVIIELARRTLISFPGQFNA
jgi:hypothetical protein